MDNGKEAGKAPMTASKSFMAVGPGLHYSHENVQRCWLMALVVFGVCCVFWSRIVSGSFWSFDFQVFITPELWHLDRFTVSGVSIFEYPGQIFVLGLAMGILAVVPVLSSQLMSFSYSVAFILAVAFLAGLPGFALHLIVSCVAVACRPLRFRSRYTSLALCMAPQLFYWAYFGGVRGVEPIKWGLSFTPWIGAWLVAMVIAAVILGIGHLTRYKPGLIWIFTSSVLVLAVIVFGVTIGFDELDYQLYVAKNNPEQASEFHDRGITEPLDKMIMDPAVRKYFADFFYPTELIPLRAELKKEIQFQISSHDRWPSWFKVPAQLMYQQKRQWLFEQYDQFINERPKSRRMPIALYYKAILSEYNPDASILGRNEVLHFYSDYPYERSRKIWYRLYSEFGKSRESIEARWRIAKHWAGQGKFERADKLLVQASVITDIELKIQSTEEPKTDTFFSLFRPPSETVITEFRLNELHRKISYLRNLISDQNRIPKKESLERLAKFVMLNPHSSDYSWQLDDLLVKLDGDDRLRDNVLLAKAKLIADDQLRSDTLAQLHEEFKGSDGAMESLYELTRLKIHQYHSEADDQQKKKHLFAAREALTEFIALYPDSFRAEQARKNLADLPAK